MAHTDILRPTGVKTAWTWDVIDRHIVANYHVSGGESAYPIIITAAGVHTIDRYVDALAVSFGAAPGVKEVTVTCTNGTSTMTTGVMTGATVSALITANAFEWDVSAQPLTVAVTTTAGTPKMDIHVEVETHHIVIT